MILGAARDTDFIFALGNELGRVRQEFHLLVMSGEKPEPDFWEKNENVVIEKLKRIYFGAKSQEAIGVDSPSDGNINEHYNNHSQKLGEYATFATHEKLKNIPCVGEENL